MALHLPVSAGPAGSAGAAWAERLLLLLNASATWLQQDIRACLCVSVYMWSQKVRRPDDSLLPRRLLPAGLGRAGEEGQALLLPLPALAAVQALSLLPHICATLPVLTNYPPILPDLPSILFA